MLTDKLKKEIQTSYSHYLKAKNHTPRHGQKMMIAAIARSVGGNEATISGNEAPICVVEAGTGTGKTVAYLLAALPIAKAKKKKVVVSTATVALQEQIVFKDLPDIREHSGLEFEFALAKGRGRYLCLSKLDRMLSGDTDELIPLYEENGQTLTGGEQQLYTTMMDKLSEGAWNGDRDSWPDELEGDAWSRVTTDHRQCTGRRCSHIRSCSFFKARETLDEVDCIVANHDLVLADLALGGGAILSKPEDTIYIFDEAHHLPSKAVNHFASHSRLVATSRWLGQTEGQWKNLIEPLSEASYFLQLAAPVEKLLSKTRKVLDAFQPQIAPYIAEMDRTQSTPRYRFPEGQVPAAMEEAALGLEMRFKELAQAFEKLSIEVGKILEEEHATVPKVDAENLFALMGSWWSRAEGNAELWRSYAHSKPDKAWPVARWITLIDFGDTADFEIVASPILASNTLRTQLWEQCAGAVATSATLTALGSYDRFRIRAGTPQDATYEVVPSPFNYPDNAVLALPKNAVEANNPEQHTQNLIENFPEIIDTKEGSLVLFSSRRQMHDVYEGLPSAFQNLILMQGEGSKQKLIETHRERIDDKQGSVLFGLASFAEGLDLPGDYCRHVLIAKIPFSVPDDPVEAAMAEWVEAQGGNAFMQLSVPDAAVKLVQACGRLLRTESDSGKVTLMDKRIVTKRYGKAIVDSLPPFRLEL